MKTQKFVLPLKVVLARKTVADKGFILNLNQYRNTFHITLNDAKIKFKQMIHDQLMDAHMMTGPIKATYKVFPASNAHGDLDNVTAVVKKFFQDALTEYEIIKDDTMDVISMNVELVGHVDSANPRVEVDLEELGDEWSAVNSMQAQLDAFRRETFETAYEELSGSGRCTINADLFKEYAKISTLNKKSIGTFLIENFGYKHFVVERNKKILNILDCK